MSKNRLFSLAAAVVIMLPLVALLYNSAEPSDSLAGDTVLPALREQLNQVDRLSVTRGDETVTLLKDDSGWVVSERFQFPADFAELAQILRGAAEMKVLETKTSDQALFHRLGLGPEADLPPILLGIHAGDRSWQLWLGNRASNQQGQYVLKDSAGPVLLVDPDLSPAADPAGWLSGQIMKVDAASIRSVLVRHPDGEELAIAHPDPLENAVLENLPEGKSLQSSTAPNSITRSLASLRMEDVLPRSELSQDALSSAQFELTGDRTLLLQGARLNGEHWVLVSLGSDFSDEDLERWSLRPDVDEWAYKVNAYAFGQIFPAMGDMVE